VGYEGAALAEEGEWILRLLAGTLAHLNE